MLAWAPQIAWWTIPIALGVELLALRWAFALGWKEAIAADLLMNLASSAGGLLLAGAPAIWFETALRPAAAHGWLAGYAILCGDMVLLALGDVAIETWVSRHGYCGGTCAPASPPADWRRFSSPISSRSRSPSRGWQSCMRSAAATDRAPRDAPGRA